MPRKARVKTSAFFLSACLASVQAIDAAQVLAPRSGAGTGVPGPLAVSGRSNPIGAFLDAPAGQVDLDVSPSQVAALGRALEAAMPLASPAALTGLPASVGPAAGLAAPPRDEPIVLRDALATGDSASATPGAEPGARAFSARRELAEAGARAEGSQEDLARGESGSSAEHDAAGTFDGKKPSPTVTEPAPEEPPAETTGLSGLAGRRRLADWAVGSESEARPGLQRTVELPKLRDIDGDRQLRATTAWRRYFVLTRPFMFLAAYALAAHYGLWLLAPVPILLAFIASATALHDLSHGSLHMGKRATELALAIIGAAILQSGHAYRVTHLQHHSRFPSTAEDNDPEGFPANMSLLSAVFYGPAFMTRLWAWAFVRRPALRPWLVGEYLWSALFVLAGALLWAKAGQLAPLFYALAAIIGGWSISWFFVWLPHMHYKPTELGQARTLRGWLLPKLLMGLYYHLEHHLYPQVPGHNLPELSRRLDPIFKKTGVKPWKLF